ncbi:hypothetical protein FVB9288_02259 [Flavobacterium sp. CECT 9288]|uniref:RHS repeat domain-containing protein n=1 Tax=Flavobacterium sp. CECT 9288 TaxID=2845819 RepID=UPI001E4A8137|nr:RHS repeat-associated core domain-containing protein [Flavobacterium sp. CECT 9288]CAH0336553.1 hypothetical protein FVB9288_02259 [Flavobacterium sp. CECT 9288]
MKKYIFFFVLLPLFSFSQSITSSDLILTGSGGGSGNITVTNNVLTVTFSGSWSPQAMKTGVIKVINASQALPDLDLGPIPNGNVLTGYKAKIENNNLVFYSPFFLSGINTTVSVPILGGASGVSASLTLPNLYSCVPSGGGGSSGEVTVSNGIATLYLSGGWDNTCNLRTGILATFSTSVPDVEFGILSGSNNNPTAYGARISDNNLIIYLVGTMPAVPGGCGLSYSKNLGDFIVLSDSTNHWTHQTSYDINGNIINSSRTFFDDLGKSDVSLSKDFQNNKVWGTETIFDEKGRPFRTSFIAPSTSNSFEKTSFLRAYGTTGTGSFPQQTSIVDPISTNQNVRATQLITASSTIAAGTTVSFTAPQIVLTKNFTAGPGFTATAAIVNEDVAQPNLYQYYSDANTAEPYQATATHPFSEVVYDELNPGNTVKVIGGNKINGDWKNGFSYTLPAAQEMYYAFGAAYFDGDIQSQGEVVVTKFFKTVVQDANGIENVSFSDGEGKVLATGTSGRGSAYPVLSLIGTQGFIDVHIPQGVVPATLIGSASDYKIYNLKTGALHTGSLSAGNFYRIEAVIVPTAEPEAYITSGGGVTYSAGAKGVTYTVNYADFALNYYDKTGRLSKTIQPKGYQNNTSIVATPAHTLATTYTYNTLGQVIAVSSPDEGSSRFAYRKDGQIRYSQNALQSDTQVSYTEYDSLGRPIESGVITGTAGMWAAAIANPDGTLLTGTRSEQTFTIYDDYKDFTTSYAVPANLDLAALLTSRGLNPGQYIPNNLSGNVAVTFNDTSFTWYSYDLYGRTEWVVQNILGFGLKTVHYTFDENGRIKKVIYQKDTPSEMFVHQYTYQIDGSLLTVATSVDNINFKEHAKYKYYQTGELKRVELAQGLQGIDYVYTLGGALKSINHPSLEKAKDPGGDANDVFGITLDYYNGDYLRSDRNISTSPTVAGLNQDNYDGNIKASRWANRQKDVPNPLAEASASNAAQQRGYMYNYNANNWLTQSSFGNVSGNAISPATAFKEGDITYDKNGNILTLQRAKEDGTVIDNFTYKYDKGNNQLTHVDDAVVGNTDLQDLKDQNTNNYVYDVLGRMTENVTEGLKYTYNTQGLVTKVEKGSLYVITFGYNERGHRIWKSENFNSGNTINTEYYAVDLAGNAMGLYYKSSGRIPTALYQKENPIFGASRLGVFTRGRIINGKQTASKSSYEITDHLGNVRAVIQENPNVFSILLSYADYYAFGEQLPSRNTTSDYRYAFQGQELDKETGMEAFQLRLWDGRIGRWLSPDPYGQYASPYLGMGNNPVSMVDPDGGKTIDPPLKGVVLKEVVVYNTRVAKPRDVSKDLSYVFKAPIFNFPLAPRVGDDWWWNKLAIDGSRYGEHNGFKFLLNDGGYAVKNLGPVPLGGTISVGPGGGGVNLLKNLRPNELLKLGKNLRNVIKKGRAPKGVERVDIPKLDPLGNPIHNQKVHLHLKDGRALNLDGTWKHGEGEVSKNILEWIKSFID